MTESKWWDRGNFGRLARILGGIGFGLSFAGVAILGFLLFMAVSEAMFSGFGSFPFGGSGFSPFDPFMGISYVMSPAIKGFACFLAFFGLALTQNHDQRKISGALFIICGAIMIPPIVFGELFSQVLQLYGLLPFIPHFISGTLLIIAGALAIAWVPPSFPTHFIPATVEEKPAPDEEPTTCYYCKAPLLGREKYCPECGVPLETRTPPEK